MTGYTPDEKLRLQQLRVLRRQWLKDQELSPREPVLPPRKTWPLETFWNNFLRDGALWKKVVSDEPHRLSSHAGSQPGHPPTPRLLSVPSGPDPPSSCPGGPSGTVSPGTQVCRDCHIRRVLGRDLESGSGLVLGGMVPFGCQVY